jgi:hypothetical protein
MMSAGPTFERWVEELRERYLSELSFQELRRALQALSTLYVAKRHRVGTGVALAGAGKRAAFALFYAPIHFLVVDRIIRALGAARRPLERVVDLGCGTLPAGAAWATACGHRPPIHGYDVNRWTLEEARRTLATWGLTGRLERADAATVRLPAGGSGIVAAWAANELADPARARLLDRLLGAHRAGAAILVVEPIAKRQLAWWPRWSEQVEHAGGRADTWRFDVELPPLLRELDRAAGMRHAALKARSIYLPPS